jgi:hypothetical protein
MKRLLIQLLIRLTDIPKAPQPDTKTAEWLAASWIQEGFRAYLYGRERKLMEYLSRGEGGSPVNRDNYLLAFGQLQELTNFMSLAKSCYEHKQNEARTHGTIKSKEANAAPKALHF